MKFYKKIKDTEAMDRAHRPVRWIWSRLPEALIGLISLAIIAFAVASYFPEVSRFASRLITGNRYLAVIDGFFNPFRNRNALLEAGLPIYDLKIKRGQYSVLENVAQKSLQKGWMSDDLKVWVDGQFFYNGEKYNVKVRLRGDLPSHWKDPKKSYRIKFGRQKIEHEGETIRERIYFEGKRQINLIIPQDRDLILAYFINQVMREQGLTVPRDRFVVLRLNGVLQGVYYEVEHLDKPMLAAGKRPETTIFGQNNRVMHFDKYTKLGIPTSEDARFDIGSMRRSIDEDGSLAMRAMQVLIDHSLNPTEENFRRAREVLDWEKYLRFRNITTLCNTNHVRFGSDNLRLYFDPSRGLLEPIPWDVHLVKLPNEPGTIDFWNSHGPDELQIATLTTPELRLQRNRLMWELVHDRGAAIMRKFDKIYNELRPVFWQDVLSTPNKAYKLDMLRKNLKYNLERVHTVLSNSNVNMTFGLEAHDRAKIEFATLNFGGAELLDMQLADTAYGWEGAYQLFEDSNGNGKLDAADRLLHTATAQNNAVYFPIQKTILPDVRYNSDWIKMRYWEFYETISGRSRFFLTGKLTPKYKDPLVWHPPVITVRAQNAVTGEDIPSMMMEQDEEAGSNNSLAITAYDMSAPFDLDAVNLSREEFLAKHPQFRPSTALPNAVELRGKVTFSETVIVPKHVPLVFRPGADVTMKPRVSILAYGGLRAEGTEKDSIRIHGDGSGIPWGVLATVRPTDRDVRIRYLRLSDAGQARINGILVTGGLAVHEGDLTLTNSMIRDMDSEDGMNLKNGHIYMADCQFINCNADNVDLDFCTGEVRRCEFRQSGFNGDGLDVSGTSVLIADCVFENLSDKGISVGENSHPTIVNCLLRGNDIGISCKDLSHPKIAHSTFVGNKLAIEAKRKKPFFGGGAGDFVNCAFIGNLKFRSEDYFSAGKVQILASVADRGLDGKEVPNLQLQADLSLESIFAAVKQMATDQKVSLLAPEWLPEEAQGPDIQFPGIYRVPGRHQQGMLFE